VKPHRRLAVHVLAIAMCLAAVPAAHAHCNRAVQVPVSATGHSVLIESNRISGIYPDMLRALGAKEKCRFVLTAVPRARLEKLFETGKADMIVASTRSMRRDEFGIFIPMVRSRATLIALGDAERTPFKTTQDVQERKDTRLVLVRGYDYGSAYSALIDAMAKDNRLLMESDPSTVARLMKANPGDVTIMVPTIFYTAVQEDTRLIDQLDRIRIEPLDDLPWGESGVYLSRTSMEPALFQFLQTSLLRTAQSGSVHKGFAGLYPPALLKDSIRPLGKGP
jgi:polar amino acid transport system substrate-binding protein